MIVKNIKSGKYEIIEGGHSYYFNVVFSKYNINIMSPMKKTHILLREKINHVYN